MLSLRPVQVMVLFVLAVLLICPVGSYANHDIDTNSGWWPSIDDKQVFWKVTTGEHDWNSSSTYSWHRVFIQNHSDLGLAVEFRWNHKVKNVGTNDTKTDNSSGGFSVAAGEDPVSGSREGWLGPDFSGWLVEGDTYEIESKTRVSFENDDGEEMLEKRVIWTTTFTW